MACLPLFFHPPLLICHRPLPDKTRIPLSPPHLHPSLPPPPHQVKQCGKMQMLDRLLTRLHARGHKVLIFSQVRGS